MNNTHNNRPGREIIRLEGLKKTFESQSGGVVALNGIDLSVREGNIYGIIGISGAGKSTLIRCINRLETPDEGRIYIDGEDITLLEGEQLYRLRHSIGMIFQQFNLFMQRSVLHNVTFPLEILKPESSGPDDEKQSKSSLKAQNRRKAIELLKLVGLEDKIDAYPSQLSGGQKQRVAIARALAADPKMLLCDEATSALDPMTTRSILDLLQEINRRLGITIVMITHQMEVIQQICTHVAVIENGRIAEYGDVTEVSMRPRTAAAKKLFRTSDIDFSLPVGKGIRIIFEGDKAHEPIIANMVLASGAPINILSGKITRYGGKAFGQLVIALPHDAAAASAALSYLSGVGLSFEEVN
ncbi:MAG: methionine ABC transporter ATP-binding protein [Christensenellales bacterium]|jgi:D-methionine transport system ATP-binding protein